MSLRHLMDEVRNLYNRKIYPEKLDARVRAIFSEATEFEFFPDSKLYLPTKPVEVDVKFEYVRGGMQPFFVADFLQDARQIAWLIDIFLRNTDNHQLNLPAHKSIHLSKTVHTIAELVQ